MHTVPHAYPDPPPRSSPSTSVLLVCAAAYLGIANARQVRDTQRETVINSGPVLQQLDTIKFSGLRIISRGHRLSGCFAWRIRSRNAARMRDEEAEIVARDAHDLERQPRTHPRGLAANRLGSHGRSRGWSARAIASRR